MTGAVPQPTTQTICRSSATLRGASSPRREPMLERLKREVRLIA
jgi:hypothetical protein